MIHEFEPATENPALKRAIVARITNDGEVSFRDFMAMALYHPHLGYYMIERDKLGREGDYITSPETSPIFGALIGRQLREMWQALGTPAWFDVVEPGAGTGRLARDILSWAQRAAPDFSKSVHYTIVEVSDALAGAQRRTLEEEGLTERLAWMRSIPRNINGCILSNELLDALPVHRVIMKGARLREIYITWTGDCFAEEFRDPSPAIEAYFADLNLMPGEGCSAEVNLEALDWIRNAAAALERGFVLTFDYGYEAAELYAPWRTGGTLLCFYRHNPSADPYARIGRQDITSHVDFTSARRAGEDAGLTTIGIVSQSHFLANLRIGEALAGATTDRGLEEYFARRRSVTDLIDPAGLGRIRVLVQSRDAGEASLSSLAEGGVPNA